MAKSWLSDDDDIDLTNDGHLCMAIFTTTAAVTATTTTTTTNRMMFCAAAAGGEPDREQRDHESTTLTPKFHDLKLILWVMGVRMIMMQKYGSRMINSKTKKNECTDDCDRCGADAAPDDYDDG